MDSELQIGLAGLGVVAVAGIVAFNKWQERKHRRHAEQAFKSEHRDVLLEPRVAGEHEGARIEPWADDEDVDVAVADAPAAPAAAVASHSASPRRATPGNPEALDTRVDCIVRIESIEPLQAPRLWAAQREQLEGLERPVRWFGFDDGENLWRPLTAHSAGAYHWFCAAMQMADRRGAIGEHEFMRFTGGVQRVADQFLAVPATMPARTQTLGAAAELDRFCAGVDVQIGVNVLTDGPPFAGTKVRSLAEAKGMVLADDGCFHARDAEGNTLFGLCNLEPALFAADEMRNLQTSGLTLVIDVPRVADGMAAFDRMMQYAGYFAEALDGKVVDDNRAPFGPDAVAVIRAQIQQFQAQMASHGIPAGSPLAMRLFSA